MAEEIVWLSMKQVMQRTGLSPTTISRYKDTFPEFVFFRYNGNILEFPEQMVGVLRRIYSMFQERSEGRRTNEKVRELLYEEYHRQEPDIVDVELPVETPEDKSIERYNALTAYLEEQDRRIGSIEIQNERLLSQQEEILVNQQDMKRIMNEHLDLLSTVARQRMGERKRGFWSRLFGAAAENR